MSPITSEGRAGRTALRGSEQLGRQALTQLGQGPVMKEVNTAQYSDNSTPCSTSER